MAVTRRQLRQAVGQQLGDLVVLTATEDSPLASIFIDRVNLVLDSRAYQGRQIVMSGGNVANLGLIRRVTGSSRDYHSITLDADLTEAPVEGDSADMMNWRGVGWTISDYNMAINAAIRNAGDTRYMVPLTQEIAAEDYNTTTGKITTPDNFVFVDEVAYKIEYADYTHWEDVFPGRIGTSHGWQEGPMDGTVEIGTDFSIDAYDYYSRVDNFYATTVETPTFRVRGWGRPSELATDDDETDIPTSWLEEEIKMIMLRRHLTTNPTFSEMYGRLYADAQRRADMLNPTMAFNYGPFAIRVRP